MKAHQYLSRLARLDARVNNKLQERTQIRDLMLKVGDAQGRSRRRLRRLEREIDEAIDKFVDLRMEAMDLLERLPAEEYMVLHQYYVQGRTMEVIAASMGMSVRNAYSVKGRALQRIQAMLDAKKA